MESPIGMPVLQWRCWVSRMISTELANNVSNQQHVGVASEGRTMTNYTCKITFWQMMSCDINFPIRDPVNRELQSSSDLFLAKVCILRRYTEMQNSQTKQGMESMSMTPQHVVDTTKQEIAHFNGFDYITMTELPSQKGSFLSPSNSSSSTFHTHQLVDADKVSSCNLFSKMVFHEGLENWSHQKPINVQGACTARVKDPGVYILSDGLQIRQTQAYVDASREPSQSESSAAAPVISSGLDACEGVREQIMDNIKDDRKRKSLERYGSITSAVSEDKGDTTKKRRVERSRKMAEAKERNLTPSVPSDMQAVLKRCETLEKEVRSLKLNLSFMNRSEQTKQIEDLQKQNEDLADEKERLLEEIERIVSETGKI
ncbi:hypothetical protein JHK82_018749 [Glycine max]|nr:hypothetical protein JHK82_018749 [Glycine max]